ncbi:DUF2510 domain-containing protein, partial [Kitasatospora sp. NPDC059571]|uniref:DUF2510 domain-containing protein n=1 Tax=Kitasatospora sp. NPDC059571 TaxID=3346871 RepID=UPI0036BBB368
MSTSTPPGWYPVTGPDGTAQERWWDGTAWTADVRPAAGAAGIADAPTQAWAGQAAAPPAAGYGYPPQQAASGYGYPQQAPGYPYPSASSGPKNRNGLIVGIAAGVLVLAGVIGAAVVLAGKENKGPTVSAPPAASASPSTGSGDGTGDGTADSPSPAPSASDPGDGTAPTGIAGIMPDVVHGWLVPRPGAWSPHTGSTSSTVYETTGPYDCGMSSQCIRGQFSVETASVPGSDAATVARTAMAAYAPRIFGELDGHQELTSGPIRVAGATGYAVRWYVTPKEGAKGYILMVAVPDARGSGFVLLHGGVDDDPRAPRLTVVEQIVGG